MRTFRTNATARTYLLSVPIRLGNAVNAQVESSAKGLPVSNVLTQVERGIEPGWEHVCLDGTLVVSTRCRVRSESGHDLWYSGKHRRHGGNVQVLTDPTGYPVCV